MIGSQRLAAALLCACLLYLSGCASPSVYRPEVEVFQKATAEMSKFIAAKRGTVGEIREELRRETLIAEGRPALRTTRGCREAIIELSNRPSVDGAPAPLAKDEAAKCRLEVRPAAEGEAPSERLVQVLNPSAVLDDSAAFASAVSEYAASLNAVATAGDRASFVEAVDGLATSARSVALSASEAARGEDAATETGAGDALGPIARFVGLAASFALEERRAEALRTTAQTAHAWIEDGSNAVAQALFSAQVEVVLAMQEALAKQLQEVALARESAYVAEVDKAVAMTADLRRALAADPAAPLRALPAAHAKLLAAFEDRERELPGALAASKELLEAAREAREALIDDDR